MLKVRCKNCNTILESHPSKTRCCGCDNLVTIRGEKITAVDLTKVELIGNIKKKENKGLLSREDLAFQEERKNRKVRKLEFEIR